MQVSKRTKFFYGIGFASQGIKDGLFQVFLFFYYSQILGLDAALTGTATIIALFFDAISDPLVGVISDNWTSKKWGKRHPFMFLSAIPLGLSIYFLFLPPESSGQMGLFWWLTVFTILVRFSLTLFIVPAMSLGAELSTDYEERTSITSVRIMFGTFFSMVTIILGFVYYFVPTEEVVRGLMNQSAYAPFALMCAFLIVVVIFISTWGTKNEIPRLQSLASSRKAFSMKNFFYTIGQMVKLKSFNAVVLFTMMVYIGLGIGTVFTTYYMEYYFQLKESEMAFLPISSGLGGVLALIFAPRIAKKFDKKFTVIFCTALFALLFSAPYNLRKMGIFPENGDPNLMVYFFLSVLGGYLFLWIVLSIVNSMMPDVVDEYELKMHQRDEGLFFASLSFAYKLTVGVGYFLAGILLTWIAFPSQTAVEDMPVEAIEGLGTIGGPITLVVYLSSIVFILRYNIDKQRYLDIRAKLEERKRD